MHARYSRCAIDATAGPPIALLKDAVSTVDTDPDPAFVSAVAEESGGAVLGGAGFFGPLRVPSIMSAETRSLALTLILTSPFSFEKLTPRLRWSERGLRKVKNMISAHYLGAWNPSGTGVRFLR